MKAQVKAVVSGDRWSLNCALWLVCLLVISACDLAAKQSEPDAHNAQKHLPFKGPMLRRASTSEFPTPGIEVVDPWLGTVVVEDVDLLQRSGGLRVELLRPYCDKSRWVWFAGFELAIELGDAVFTCRRFCSGGFAWCNYEFSFSVQT